MVGKPGRPLYASDYLVAPCCQAQEDVVDIILEVDEVRSKAVCDGGIKVCFSGGRSLQVISAPEILTTSAEYFNELMKFSRGTRLNMAAAKKLVVCGGNGFLGSRICQYAIARGWDVTSIRYVFHAVIESGLYAVMPCDNTDIRI